MFSVIYSFQPKAGQERAFMDAWEGMTKLIHEYEGSLGSRLHKNVDGSYIAYAQWPDRQRWESSGPLLPSSSKEFSAQMRHACSEIRTLFELEMVNDLLVH